MKTILSFFVCFVVMAGLAVPANAGGKPPKELVETLSKKAFDAFITVKNPEGQTIVKPEDAKKLKYPLVPYNEREMAVARGYISGYAKWCGLSWDKDYFLPYLKAMRAEHKKSWTDYQYAYVSMLHGLAMSVSEKGLKGKTCDAAEKEKLAALAKK